MFNSYSELISTYGKYVRGEVDSCPTYDGPLDEESVSIKPYLVRLNELNILTIDSQPGIKTSMEDGVEQQRAYLEFLIQRTVWDDIHDDILMSSLVVFPKQWANQVVCDVEEDGEDTNVVFFPVTMFVTDSDDSSPQLEITSMASINTTFQLDSLLETIKEEAIGGLKKDLIYVHIIDTVWNRQEHLFTTLIDALERVGGD